MRPVLKQECNNVIRSILIFVYIAVVLLVSGLAQAAEFAQVNNAKFNQESYMLHVRGAFLNSCQTAPKPVLLTSIPSADAETVVIGVRVDSVPGIVCAQVVNRQFELVFDIRTLHLASKKDLVLKFKNFAQSSVAPITARIEHEAHGLQFAAVETQGTLIEMASVGFDREPQYAVLAEDGRAVHIKSLVDLSDYVNNKVRVAGIWLGHTLAPQLDAVELDISKKTGEQPEQLFATEISFTPLQ